MEATRFSIPNKLMYVLIQMGADEIEFWYAFLDKSKKKDNQVKFERVFSINALKKKMRKSIPLIVHFTGKGIVTRWLDSEKNWRQQSILSSEENLFLFNATHFSSGVISTFIRKDKVDPILNEIRKTHPFVHSIFLGISPFLQRSTPSYAVRLDYEIRIENNSITSVERSDEINEAFMIEPYKQKISHLEDYLFGRDGFNSRKFEQGIDEEEFNLVAKNYSDYRAFVRFAVLVLVVLWVVLGVNYSVNQNLNTEIQHKESELETYSLNVAYRDQLLQERNRKFALYQFSGLNSSTYFYQLIDELTLSTPEEIKLQELVVFPLRQNSGSNKQLEFDRTVINVIGNSPNSMLLNNWITFLNKLSWVKSVEIVSFEKSPLKGSQFLLRVTPQP